MLSWNEPWSLKGSSIDRRIVIRTIIVVITNHALQKPIVKRRNLEIIFNNKRKLVIRARPPRLKPLPLQSGVPGPIVNQLLPESPLELIHEIQDLLRATQAILHGSRIRRGCGEVIDVDVEVNALGVASEAVIGGGEGEEAAGEGVEAVKGEDFDEESERWEGVVVDSLESGVALGDGVCGLGEEDEEDDDGDAEEEEEERE